MNQALRRPAPNPFDACLDRYGLRLVRAPLQTLQVNVGKLCNQACHHCHVDAGPKRTEIMTWETMARILDWVKQHGDVQGRTSPGARGTSGCAAGIRDVDITGGAPEVNPDFRRFVDGLLAQGASVTARCNLTVLLEPGQEDLADWYAARGVRLVCSLPCYTRANVDGQRGRGAFDKSIDALRRLNAVGYGRTERLALDLVYNPGGAFLPGPQAKLEADYRNRLRADFGIGFTRLLTLANLPINRFAHWLAREGKHDAYLQLLEERFNPETVPALMCRHLLSVDWRGYVYDCDFNQMLDLPLAARVPRLLWDIDPKTLDGAAIATGPHCLGCTAGAGSGCGGALSP